MSIHFSRLQEKKEENFLEGCNLLHSWLQDTLTTGLYSNKQLDKSMSELSSRLVDFGLPSVARKLRVLRNSLSDGKEITELVFPVFSELSLFCRMMEQLGSLDMLEKEDLLTYAGIPFLKKQIPEEHAVQDSWMYLGMSRDTEEKMQVYRHWFYGIHGHKNCLYIEFKFGNWNNSSLFFPGQIYRGAVSYFPSRVPVRIAEPPAKKGQLIKCEIDQFHTVEQALDHFAWLMSYNPFIQSYTYLLKDVRFACEQNKWYVFDNKSGGILLDHDLTEIPRLVSLSNHPQCQFVAEYKPHAFRFLNVIIDGKLVGC
ncbi:MAG: hypothetical protein IPM34_04690 [Saprospiraceae bacterium]|nr:hypothetical protein [Saprospiraceae bacterium]